MEEDTHRLTQFAPPSTDAKSSQSFFSRLLGRVTGVSPNNPPVAYSPAVRNRVSIKTPGRESPSLFREQNFNTTDASSAQGTRKKVVRNELRTFTNVLGRLMNILDKKSSLSGGLRPYKDSDFRQSWMPDSSCKECYDCGSQFTTFLRRHHCRICGQIFCSSCCNQEVPGRVIGFEGGLRACTYCCAVVSDLMKESDDDLGTLRDNVKAQLSNSTPIPADIRGSIASNKLFSPSRKFSTSDSFEMSSNHNAGVFDIAPVAEPMGDMTSEERESLVKNSLQLKALFFEMLDPVDGIHLMNRRHRLKVYSECFQGNELVTWLLDCDKAHDDNQAIIIGQALMDAEYLMCLTDDNISIFSGDYTLYKFRQLTYEEDETKRSTARRFSVYPETLEDEPEWIQDLEQADPNVQDFAQSSTYLRSVSTMNSEFPDRARSTITDNVFDLESKTNISPSLISHEPRNRLSSNDHTLSTKEDINDILTLATADPSTCVSDQQTILNNQFRALYKDHISELCVQLLEKAGVSRLWMDTLMDLGSNISHFVKPDVCLNKDQMDIAPYVHIKKVRSGEPSESSITYGAICTKSVVHNKMKTSIRSPLIMLLQSSVEYHRVTNKLSSLGPQILQEREYLQNCVARICKYKPDILLVESTVSHVAQQLLLDAGVTVVINVKSSVMLRIARMTMADLIPSLDSLINPPRLGTCYKFQTDVHRFSDGYFKTLMQFSGCPANLGCTVLLRGSSYPELIKVKPILMTVINACYHAKLEISYLIDQSATPASDIAYKQKRRHASGESRDSVDLYGTKALEPSRRTDSPDFTSSALPVGEQYPDAGLENIKFESLRQALQKVILDYSPVVQVHPPYFETEKGRLCSLRQLFPNPPHWSALLTGGNMLDEQIEMRLRGVNEVYDYRLENTSIQDVSGVELKKPHKFVKWGMNGSARQKRLKQLCAMFRASGNRLSEKSPPDDRSRAFSGFPVPVSVDKHVDCLDINNHQSISVLFSSYTLNTGPHHCVKPWVVHMCFYSKNDLTLGQFLERYCFNPDYRCPRVECEVPMIEHIRRFVYKSNCLYLIVRKGVEPQVDEEGADNSTQTVENSTVTWRWCKRCKKATSLVPLSPATWHLSFARFLQIQFNCTLSGSGVSEDCVHSMSTSYHQYFQFKDVVAIFKPSGIILREVLFPPAQVFMQHKISQQVITSRIKIVHTHGLGFFSDVMELICKLELDGVDGEDKRKAVDAFKPDLEIEKKWFTDEIDRVQSTLLEERAGASTNSEYILLQQLEDDVIRLQCHLSRSVQQWNIKIQAVCTKDDKGNERKKPEGKLPRNTNSVPRAGRMVSRDELNAGSLEAPQFQPASFPAVSGMDPDGPVLSTIDVFARDLHNGSPSSFDSTNGILSSSLHTEYGLGLYHQSVSEGLRAGTGRAHTVNSTDSIGSYVVCEASAPSAVASPASQPANVTESKPLSSSRELRLSDHTVQSLAIPSGSMDTDHPLPARLDQLKVSQVSQNDSIVSTEIVSSLNSVDSTNSHTHADTNHLEHSETISPKEPVHHGADSVPSSPIAKDLKSNPQSFSRFSSGGNDHIDTANHKGKRQRMLKKSGSKFFLDSVKIAILSTADDATTTNQIENPFSDNEHFLLEPTLNVPIIIYDEEPSSIIAYSLGSKDYDIGLMESQAQKLAQSESASKTAAVSPLLPESGIKTDDIETVLKLTHVSSVTASIKAAIPAPQPALDSVEAEPSRYNKSKDRLAAANSHIEMEFTEKSESGDKIGLFYCKVYFAAEFKKLRELIYPEGEEQFIRSLSRCYKWNAKGGKSGLGFCKTKDERFIMKQMVRQEIQSFMDFGPHYFDYVTESLTESDLPKDKCTLAKILGVYKIGLKNFVTNAVFRQDVLIIENLFYNRRIRKVFDLKGSDRNRLTKRESSVDSVLLDENFMKYCKQNPMYVRDHTKNVLMSALLADSQFLAKHKVMDYSLLCGYDEDTKELVIGIIDYIRTFTWDKKLETYVKSSGLLGGQGKMPTIVSPEIYRTRFIEAMERYFNVVPDRWTSFPYANT